MPDSTEFDITGILHPIYHNYMDEWEKWRLTYESGSRFIDKYTKKFSSREDNNDFNDRKSMTYCPAFAKADVNEIKNSIFQRMVDITRTGGTPSYRKAIIGGEFGVDLLGSSMNSFIGRIVLPELLVMKKVGVYIDMPRVPELSLADTTPLIRPYLYTYCAEDIRSWQYDDSPTYNEFRSILLREHRHIYDQRTSLPIDTITVYKHFWRQNNKVYVQEYTNDSKEQGDIIELDIPRIPFVVFEISDSLMRDIADYQIALLNLASSDISYSLKSNFPFYVEQFDPRVESSYLKDNPNKQEADVSPTSGRQYPPNMDRPAFIHPSSEPLLASMKKQDQLKEEIRLLLNLTISSLQPTRNSAASKSIDEHSLESGLSYIGLELEHGELQIGQIWSMYENSRDYPTIHYPEKYNLKSDEDRRNDSKQLKDLLPIIASKTYQKEISKEIVNLLLRNKVSDETLKAIEKEIDQAQVLNIDPETISKDIEQGLVGLTLASEIRGYPKDQVDAAKNDHAERLTRIAISQSRGAAAELSNGASRGLTDLSVTPNKDAAKEKAASRDTTQDPIPTEKTRG